MKPFNKTCATTIAVGVLAIFLSAQAPNPVRDQKAITRVKNTLTSQLEAGMPKITLEYFLRSEAGPDAKLTWEVNDCGEQSGDPATDSGHDIPICVEADALLADGREVSVMVAVGSMKTGTTAKPQLFSVFVSTARQPVSRLRQIPAELHRDFPRRTGPRDLPALPAAPGTA